MPVAAMGMVASMCTEPIKRRRAEKDLDDKVAAALRERARSRQRTFRTVNSITMRLPRFKDGLRDIKDVFDQYGNDDTLYVKNISPLVFATQRCRVLSGFSPSQTRIPTARSATTSCGAAWASSRSRCPTRRPTTCTATATSTAGTGSSSRSSSSSSASCTCSSARTSHAAYELFLVSSSSCSDPLYLLPAN